MDIIGVYATLTKFTKEKMTEFLPTEAPQNQEPDRIARLVAGMETAWKGLPGGDRSLTVTFDTSNPVPLGGEGEITGERHPRYKLPGVIADVA